MYQMLMTIGTVLNDAIGFVLPYTFYHNSDNDNRTTHWMNRVD